MLAPSKTVVVLLGGPGSGKGTQSQLLREVGWKHVGIGNLLRREISSKTFRGRLAESYLRRGDLVPEILVTGMLKQALNTAWEYLALDGYPRRPHQVRRLDRLLKSTAAVIPIYLAVSTEVMLRRLEHRISCSHCGWVGDDSDGRGCPVCGSSTYARGDDLNAESVTRRIESFEHEVKGVLNVYEMSGRLITLNGEEPPAQIFHQILVVTQTQTPKIS
jgi:adenylate kinase